MVDPKEPPNPAPLCAGAPISCAVDRRFVQALLLPEHMFGTVSGMTDEEVMEAATDAGYRQGSPARGEYAWYRDGEQVSPAYNSMAGLVAWLRPKLTGELPL
jgi:hypothetical protein